MWKGYFGEEYFKQRNDICKDPEAGMSLVYFSDSLSSAFGEGRGSERLGDLPRIMLWINSQAGGEGKFAACQSRAHLLLYGNWPHSRSWAPAACGHWLLPVGGGRMG